MPVSLFPEVETPPQKYQLPHPPTTRLSPDEIIARFAADRGKKSGISVDIPDPRRITADLIRKITSFSPRTALGGLRKVVAAGFIL